MTTANITTLDEPTFIWLNKMLSNKEIYAMVKPVYQNPSEAAKYVEMALNNEDQSHTTELASMLEEPVQQLLKSKEASKRQLALDAIGRLDIKAPRESITALINNQAPDRTVELGLHALENDAAANKASFLQVAQNKQFPFALRTNALHTVAKIDAPAAQQALQKWIPVITDEQKKNVVNEFSSSKEGAQVLKQLYGKKLLGAGSFTISSAERVLNTDTTNATGKTIVVNVKKQVADEQKMFDKTLMKYMVIAEKKDGNAQKGKVIFQTTCLMCHKVGDKGQNIAPALDGSASRENRALLTAILNPDAAVESGYALYRVTKKDNSSIEGYLFHRDDKGTTLAFMGGSKIFIPVKNIRSEDFLQGRSFMPKGLLTSFTDAQAADLLAYIKTLK
ncbi:MAG: c-type cytochrome [Agriterribacter sp.]